MHCALLNFIRPCVSGFALSDKGRCVAGVVVPDVSEKPLF